MYGARFEVARLAAASGASPSKLVNVAETIRAFLEEGQSRLLDNSGLSRREDRLQTS
ncbi:hypothetical protein FHS61_001467 [Altererythrobacter atlanticus]|uniref:Uncharacterized protein n=1 Tax=Croceibacterium atlanticum TaxID=1267766 RepID=A0A0F7KUW0_9SPHN|nr:hypothetical protein WYH_03129 [Croceibacterium atlanticum]MBB5732458.1 hypothetical protein [Croceibacterium atlanticum]